MDVNGHLLRSFTDVDEPYHLSVVDDDNVLVADHVNHRVLLLDSQLQLQRVLIDDNSQLKLRYPSRLCFTPDTSLLRVAHSSSRESWSSWSDLIWLFRLR